MTESIDLPVPVRDHPFWRVNLRPAVYEREVIPSLADCLQLVQRCTVRLRGWDYPHLGHDHERQCGSNYVASWSDFMGHREYWRLYQSAQFIHFFSVGEASEPGWRAKLQSQTASHLAWLGPTDWDSVPGFISVVNTVYCVTEIVEFATRMAQAGVYRGDMGVAISIQGINGFVLTTDSNRAWPHHYAASMDQLEKTWPLNAESVISDSTEATLRILLWLFERFGWLHAPAEVLRKDIENFKSGRH